MKILIIDNYDSFTYNLVQLIGSFSPEIIVKRNDKINIKEVKELAPDKIVISPGPGRPEDSKVSLEIIQSLYKKIPILGVCLGHQAIGISFGAKIINAQKLMHGKTSQIKHDGKTIFKNVDQNFDAGRYHSLVLDRDSIPENLIITSETKEGVVMGIRDKNHPLEGIQFHPESILTTVGKKLIGNWVKLN
jgi:anthranilate synthase/aminodeoxychorismate synthase-like glutamine amidotransferase